MYLVIKRLAEISAKHMPYKRPFKLDVRCEVGSQICHLHTTYFGHIPLVIFLFAPNSSQGHLEFPSGLMSFFLFSHSVLLKFS